MDLVFSERRGQGIGVSLLAGVIEVARDAGADHLELRSGETAAEARAVYGSRSFSDHEGVADGPEGVADAEEGEARRRVACQEDDDLVVGERFPRRSVSAGTPGV